jgi:uncharacterized protein (DUF2141 family)
MRAITIPTLLTALILFRSASVYGASIGASFLGNIDTRNVESWRLAPADSAGVIAQTNWNNLQWDDWGNIAAPPGGFVGISDPLLDSAGNFTAVQVWVNCNDAWNSDGPIDTPDDKLMKGIVKEGVVGSSMSLSFTNLAPGAYDLYVYGNVNGGPVGLDVSIGVTTNYWTEPAAFDDGTGFIEAASTDPNARATGNYVKFTGVTPVNGGLTVVATYQGGSDGLGIAGLQLVAAGGFPTNTTPVSIARQPEPQLAVPGGTATFSVGVTGPFARYLWSRNSLPISGATSSSYTTPPVSLSDSGARYNVTVSNNVNFVTSAVAVLTVTNDPGTRVALMGGSFLGNSGDGNVEPWRLAPSDLAGAVAQTNWNNISSSPAGNVGISDLLLDSAGNPSAVQLQFDANDAWNSDSLTDTANDKLMKGIIKEGGVGSTMTLTFTNLLAGFYDVYVYGDVNGGPVDLDVSVGNKTNYWTEPAAFDNGTGFIEAASTDPAARAAGNYVKFTGVTPVNGVITNDGMITIAATYQSGSDGLGIAGVQIVSSAAFPTNTLPVVITGEPRPTVAAPGSTATFLVWATGPFARYQWFRNSTLISGATSSSYTTLPLSVSDNGARYNVTVSNNVNSVTSDVVVLAITNDPGTRVASIGASFLGNSGDGNVEPWRLAPTDSAGVVAQTHWSNINSAPTGNVGISDPLPDGTGNTSAVQLQYVANDAWNSDGSTNTPDEKLMKGIIKEGGVGSSMTLTFTNLAPAFYDVYVYGNVNGGPVDLDVSIGATTNYWTEPAAFDVGTGFIKAASSDPNARAAGNYVQFTGVTPASGLITITATYQSGSDGLGIAGVQIVSSTAFPAIATLLPNLAAALEDGQIVISWNSPASFQLQYRSELSLGRWTDEATPPLVIGDQHTVRLPANGPTRFFRLAGR